VASVDDDLLGDYTRVRLDAGMHVIEVGVVSWQGAHSPELSWVEAARLPADTAAAEVERARRKLLAQRKFFVICKVCGERNAKGHTEQRVCHGCMEKSGTVF